MKIFYIIFLLSITVSAQKSYQKKYFEDGTLKEEGWQKNAIKKLIIGNSTIPTEPLKKKVIIKMVRLQNIGIFTDQMVLKKVKDILKIMQKANGGYSMMTWK